MNSNPKVVVAMSGGVDSSVAAALLVEQGYPVVGVMLRLWSEPGRELENRCCTLDSQGQARRVADRLGIPFYIVDARQKFYQQVVQAFVGGYLGGVTPNPCFVCNKMIRWGFLLDQARALGAEYLATGHYARIRKAETGKFELLRGNDQNKDQSYVLAMLDQTQLSKTLFPLGELDKPEVRNIARRLGLQVAERSDSQDLCFLGKQSYHQFLLNHAPEALRPGIIVNRKGEKVGDHRGLAFYTIGQRKGLGIAAAQPLYVLEKDLERNALVIGSGDELGYDRLIVANVNWIAGEPPQFPLRAMVKIRYKARLVEGTINFLSDEKVHVKLDQALRDITPGQVSVFYDGDVVLGSGVIQSSG